jgi:hypothetical protein
LLPLPGDRMPCSIPCPEEKKREIKCNKKHCKLRKKLIVRAKGAHVMRLNSSVTKYVI